MPVPTFSISAAARTAEMDRENASIESEMLTCGISVTYQFQRNVPFSARTPIMRLLPHGFYKIFDHSTARRRWQAGDHAAAARADVCANRWLTMAIIDSLKREGDKTPFPVQRSYRRRRVEAQLS